MKHLIRLCILVLTTWLIACNVDTKLPSGLSSTFKTKNVVIIVVDGPRWQETWGDNQYPNIPHRSQMLKEGVLFTNFKNAGYTLTNPGHDAIMTGYHENIDNSGQTLPTYPSIFQMYREASGYAQSSCQLIISKDKLDVLANCSLSSYNNKFMPEVDMGLNGQYYGYREDSVTFKQSLNVFSSKHPRITMIHFRGPDVNGHMNNWTKYLATIKETDAYIYHIWNYLQADPFYKNSTALFVTNDHGRHNSDYKDGFVSHGDDCTGCRHIELFAMGPDFNKADVVDKPYDQRDISKTVAKLLGFKMPYSQGKEIYELVGK